MKKRIAIPTVYSFVNNTNLLGNDPILWFAMMLMPVGPPAMMLSALMEIKGSQEPEKMAVARVLTVTISVSNDFRCGVRDDINYGDCRTLICLDSIFTPSRR